MFALTKWWARHCDAPCSAGGQKTDKRGDFIEVAFERMKFVHTIAFTVAVSE